MVFDMTTQGSTGFTGSRHQRLQRELSSGRRTPAIAITTLVCPAATTPIFGAPGWAPRVVWHAGHRARRVANRCR